MPTPPLMQVETIRGDLGGYEVKGYIVHNDGEAVLILGALLVQKL